MRNYRIKRLVTVALLIAAEVVLSRFLSVPTPITKIGFAFLPVAVSGMLFGPLYGAITGGLGDLIGALAFPIGAYFPGYTITAALTGMTYGLVLHKRAHMKLYVKAAIAASIAMIPLSLGLNTLWIWITSGKGIMGILPARALQCAVMLPVQYISIVTVCKTLVVTGVTPRFLEGRK